MTQTSKWKTEYNCLMRGLYSGLCVQEQVRDEVFLTAQNYLYAMYLNVDEVVWGIVRDDIGDNICKINGKE